MEIKPRSALFHIPADRSESLVGVVLGNMQQDSRTPKPVERFIEIQIIDAGLIKPDTRIIPARPLKHA